jgi:hypothetical protein
MFIQIIDFETDRIDEGRKDVEEYRSTIKNKGGTARRGILAKDRDKPNHYVNIVFFDDYASAMKNSELPETQQLAERLGKLATNEATFINLEVIEDNQIT